MREVRDTGGYGKLYCLAVRTEGHLTAGVSGVESLRDGISTAWPTLKPWFEDLARNRGRVEAWSLEQPGDRVRLAIRTGADRPAPARRATEQALWSQIVDDPDDLATRLVLADLLMERGDVRGELIRLHHAISQLRDGSERAELKRRERQLIDLHHPWLAGDIADHASKFTIVGGFVHAVNMTAANAKKYAARCSARSRSGSSLSTVSSTTTTSPGPD